MYGVTFADSNGDGVIDYGEFVPIALDLLIPQPAPAPFPLCVNPLPRVEELSEEQLLEYLRELFSAADLDGNGVVHPSELLELLRLSGLGFSEQQLQSVMEAADANEDEVIDFQEFVPVATAVLKWQSWSRAVDPPPQAPPWS